MDAELLAKFVSGFIKLLASRYERLEIESRGEQCLYHFKNKRHRVEAEIFMNILAFGLCISEDYNAQLPPHQQVRWQLLENSGKIKILSER